MSLYRERRRRCPACRTVLDVVALPSGDVLVDVDVCRDCQGVFIEYFDGEAGAIARALPRPGTTNEAPLGAEVLCADCDTPMVLHPYLGDGPELLRCESCLAIFAKPSMLRELARYELPRVDPSTPTRPGLIAALLAWLRD